MITYTTETLRDCLDEMLPILEDHFKEVNYHQSQVPHEPDWDGYVQLENARMLHVAVARDDGKMVGYCSTVINTSLHHRNNTFGVNDALYVLPEYRKTSVAYGLLTYVFAELKSMGVDTVHLAMKVSHPFDELCEGLGMQLEERMYSKYIGD